MKTEYKSGEVFVVENYPFVRTVFNAFDESGSLHEDGWRPGAESDADEGSAQWTDTHFADGVGRMVLTVVSTHKPGAGFHERVFYVREWIDPEGRRFGKPRKLRVTTRAAFTKMIRGYRHHFEVAE